VGFRATTAGEGRRLRLAGFVRNQPDGSVEVVAEGEAGDLEALLGFLHRGPRGARVTAVEARHEAPRGDLPAPFELR
jgi:acylphosphatase